MAPCVVLNSVILLCLSSVSITHGALCGSEVCDCGCVWVLCLFLMAPCVCLKSVILWLPCVWALCLFLTAPCVSLMSVIVLCLSSVEFFPSRRPVWLWSLWLWCGCLNSVYIPSWRPVWFWSLWLWLCLSSVSIPHGALCVSEVCDCRVSELCVYSSWRPVWFWILWFCCVLVLCLLLTAPCVCLKSVIVVWLSKFCVYSSRRPVWLWGLWLWCRCLSSVSIPHGALCGSESCDCGVAA